MYIKVTTNIHGEAILRQLGVKHLPAYHCIKRFGVLEIKPMLKNKNKNRTVRNVIIYKTSFCLDHIGGQSEKQRKIKKDSEIELLMKNKAF